MDEFTSEKIAEMVKREKRKYAKLWRARNKEKSAAINNRYWEKRALRNLNLNKKEGGE